MISEGFLPSFFYRNSMQKILLSFLITAGCGLIATENLSIAEEIEKVQQKLAELQQRQRDEQIAEYKKENKAAFEDALIRELSGEAGAIGNEFTKNEQMISKEEDQERSKIYDGGWFTHPTHASKAGCAYEVLKSIKDRKNEINAESCALVTNNKKEVFSAVKNGLDHAIYLIGMQYVKGLKLCGSDVNCLHKKGINWEDINRADFFDNICNDVYKHAVIVAQKEGVDLTEEAIAKLAISNPGTLMRVKKLNDAKLIVEEELRKILNPQEDQNLQSDLSQ